MKNITDLFKRLSSVCAAKARLLLECKRCQLLDYECTHKMNFPHSLAFPSLADGWPCCHLQLVLRTICLWASEYWQAGRLIVFIYASIKTMVFCPTTSGQSTVRVIWVWWLLWMVTLFVLCQGASGPIQWHHFSAKIRKQPLPVLWREKVATETYFSS